MIPQLNVPLYMICLILIFCCNHNSKELRQLTMFKTSVHMNTNRRKKLLNYS